MLLPFSSSPCQCEDAEVDVGDLTQGEEAFDGGGTGGHDVIDEDDVLALQGIGIMEGEGVADVLTPFLVRQGCLTDVEASADEGVGDDGSGGDGADALAEEFALVVATLALAVLGYRHGDEGVGG